MVTQDKEDPAKKRHLGSTWKHTKTESVNFNELAGKDIMTFLPKTLVESPTGDDVRKNFFHKGKVLALKPLKI